MKISNVSRSKNGEKIIDNFSLELEPKTITCLCGPSGCGKTTLLNVIAGIEPLDGGFVEFSGFSEKKVSYLFQEPRLFPWRTILENVSIPLNGDEKTAKKVLELAGLGNDLEKYPSELSGGMRQRVAIARAIAYPSGAILMDEPFQNLDTCMTNILLKNFISIWEQNRKTVLWITHDITEACLVADRIICVSNKPMRIKHDISININREERTPQNTVKIHASVYNALTTGS